MGTEKTILLAGYGWFAGIPEGETNNAELIARALDGETLIVTRGDGETILGRVHGLVVPVVWETAFPQVMAAVQALHPDIVVGMGTDARISGLRPEPYGVNWQRGTDARPDAPARQTTVDGKILEDGADWLRGTLPYEAMVTSMLRAGIPALMGSLLPPKEDVPLSAFATPGLYLCNKMAYLLADYGQRAGIPAGFVHVPTQPQYAAARRLARIESLIGEELAEAMVKPISAMPLPMMIEGMRAALAACLKHSSL